jgi:uncharacterized membrane protein YdfJ with MMPL/SSD domain
MRKYYIIIIGIILLLTSCGTRKVNSTKIEETDHTKTKESVKESVKTQTKTDTKIVAEIEDFEILPIDNTKPVVINGISYTNARIKTVKAKVNTNVIEDKTESKTALKHTEVNNDIKEEIDTKKIERTNTKCIIVLVFLLLIFSGLIYNRLK